jgi:hypothetical protein
MAGERSTDLLAAMKGDPQTYADLRKPAAHVDGPTPDLVDLERLAKAATPGPWEVAGPWPTVHVGTSDASKDDPDVGYRHFDPLCRMVDPTPTDDVCAHTDAAFIAAANPTRILALLSAITAARTEAERAREVADAATKGLYSQYMLDAAKAIARHQGLQFRLDEARQESARLRQIIWAAARSQPNSELRISSAAVIQSGPRAVLERSDDPATNEIVFCALAEVTP